MSNATRSQEQTEQMAETIFAQLGGTRRLQAMAGAKKFIFGETDAGQVYVAFRVGRNAKKVNMVQVTLDMDDTYTVEFMWITVAKSLQATKNVKWEISGVYFDMLPGIFEQGTGMYLSI